MTAKKTEAPVHEAPMTFRDYPGEVPASPPVVAQVASLPDPEPAKPATKKEN
jgi:hypothetical protein